MSKVLGVIGHLYSGSTLMELVLNTHPNIMSIGEGYHFIEKFHQKNFICEICGEKKCSVLGSYPVPLDLIHKSPFSDKNIHVVIDSSKTLYVWEDIYIPGQTADKYIFISMIKEPERAMYSYLNKIRSGISKDLSEGNVPMNIYHHYKANYSYLDKISKKFNIKMISYEKFCLNPEDTLQDISNFINNNFNLNIDYKKFNIEDWSLQNNPTHRVAGNWKTVNSPKKISLDDSYLNEINDWDENTVKYLNLMKLEYNKILDKYFV